MSGYSNSKKQNVATHELGHALGLDHSTSTDVMDAAITGHTSTQALSQMIKIHMMPHIIIIRGGRTL